MQQYKGYTYTPVPKTAWDNLSLAAKAEMMKIAVRHGITTLQDIKDKYNEFAEGGSKREKEEVNTIVPFTQRREVIITPDSEYNQYLNTLPDNQRFTPNDKYDSYFYWKLNGKPKNFDEAYSKGMFHYDNSDKSYHANSIAFGKDGIGYFMKPKTHDTVGYELDWFNKGLVTEEGGKQRHMTPEEKKEWLEFRKDYTLMNDPNRPNYYKYQPKKKAEGGSIHIKPENRGKFTALKERTGHSATWFKEHGTPAQKKMAIFALNSRHWKHGLGGNLFLTGGPKGDGREEVTNLSTWDEVAAQSPLFYTIGKALDPTGVSGYGDAKEAISQYDSNPSFNNAYNAVMESLGALPVVSKAGKAIKFLQGAVTGQGIFDDFNYAQEKKKDYDDELVIDYWDNTVKLRREAEKHGEQMKSKMSYTDVHHLPSFKLAPKGSKPGQVISNYTINHRVVNKYKKAFGGNLFDGTSEDSQQMNIAIPDATYVARTPIFSPISKKEYDWEDAALHRTNQVYSNYNEAKDEPLSLGNTLFRNSLRWIKDNIYEDFPSGVSNCTLSATQWVDPQTPVKGAKSIHTNPERFNYTAIDSADVVPGNLIISKVPNKDSYHTMMVTGFAGQDRTATFKGKKYPIKKGEPLITYSRGGHDNSFIQRNVPLSIYTANSDGHTQNLFYRYNYPREVFLPEIVVTPNKKKK